MAGLPLYLRLAIVLSLAGSWSFGMTSLTVADAQGNVASADAILIEELGVLRLVDVMTGEERWHLGETESLSSAVSGAGGVVFASTTAPGAAETIVYAIDGSSRPDEIGRVPGTALVKGVSPTGDRLLFLTYGRADFLPQRPNGLATLDLPDRWRLGPPAAATERDMGGGILGASASGTGEAESYHLDVVVTQSGEVERSNLLIGTYGDADQPAWLNVALPLRGGPFTLLRTTDGSHLYVIEYGGQAVHAVDIAGRKLVASARFGEGRDKRPACAATVAPDGDRLYVLGPAGRSSTDVLVLDTKTLGAIESHTVGEGLSCMAISPDGERLYLVAGASTCSLVTVRVATGAAEHHVPTGDADCGSLHMAVPAGMPTTAA